MDEWEGEEEKVCEGDLLSQLLDDLMQACQLLLLCVQCPSSDLLHLLLGIQVHLHLHQLLLQLQDLCLALLHLLPNTRLCSQRGKGRVAC